MDNCQRKELTRRIPRFDPGNEIRVKICAILVLKSKRKKNPVLYPHDNPPLIKNESKAIQSNRVFPAKHSELPKLQYPSDLYQPDKMSKPCAYICGKSSFLSWTSFRFSSFSIEKKKNAAFGDFKPSDKSLQKWDSKIILMDDLLCFDLPGNRPYG